MTFISPPPLSLSNSQDTVFRLTVKSQSHRDTTILMNGLRHCPPGRIYQTHGDIEAWEHPNTQSSSHGCSNIHALRRMCSIRPSVATRWDSGSASQVVLVSKMRHVMPT